MSFEVSFHQASFRIDELEQSESRRMRQFAISVVCHSEFYFSNTMSEGNYLSYLFHVFEVFSHQASKYFRIDELEQSATVTECASLQLLSLMSFRI
jgi:hypothetical protein